MQQSYYALPPLYVIFLQLLSQKEASGDNIELEVQGSIKEAQAFAQEQANKDAGMLIYFWKLTSFQSHHIG